MRITVYGIHSYTKTSQTSSRRGSAGLLDFEELASDGSTTYIIEKRMTTENTYSVIKANHMTRGCFWLKIAPSHSLSVL